MEISKIGIKDSIKSYTTKYKKEIRKYSVATASLIVPGSGQVINGDTSKGVAFFLAGLLNYFCLYKKGHHNLGYLLRLGIGAFAAKDAYEKG